MATPRQPLQPSHLLASAPLSWTLLAEYESSVTVSLTVRHERTNGVHAGASYLLTSEVEILRDSWTMHSATGPIATALESTDAAVRAEAETVIGELEDDVACALDSRVRSMRCRGALNRDLVLVADAGKVAA